MSRFSPSKDMLGGLLVMVIGLATALQAQTYKIGSLRAMGPGFFPLALGVILVITGVLILLGARPAEPEARPLALQWRGWFCICAGLAAFTIMGTYGGLVPATFAVVFISAFGDRSNTWRTALILAALMTVICVIVFWWALQLQFPLFRWG